MKITFPSLGNTTFAAKAIFDGLGIDYVLPPVSNKSSLELGSLYSPEDICLPFKIMLGSYIESIKQGADTVLITGSCGPCRYGEYCELQTNILKKLVYNLDLIVLDYPKDIGTKQLLSRIGKISQSSPKTIPQQISVLKYASKIIKLIDLIERKARYYCGFEENTGECKKILKQCKSTSLNCNTPEAMLNNLKEYNKLIDNVKLDKYKNPIKIAILGEIYTILEPFSNLYIEDKLMDYGISTKRHLSPSWWVKDAALSTLHLNSLDIRTASKKYLPYYIGGHGRECVGEAVLAKKEGLDGAIQIFPMGCMPEIVSKSILPTISREENLPIMTLIVDEMTGEVGYDTRIEAFIDLLERRKNENVLYGS